MKNPKGKIIDEKILAIIYEAYEKMKFYPYTYINTEYIKQNYKISYPTILKRLSSFFVKKVALLGEDGRRYIYILRPEIIEILKLLKKYDSKSFVKDFLELYLKLEKGKHTDSIQ